MKQPRTNSVTYVHVGLSSCLCST